MVKSGAHLGSSASSINSCAALYAENLRHQRGGGGCDEDGDGEHISVGGWARAEKQSERRIQARIIGEMRAQHTNGSQSRRDISQSRIMLACQLISDERAWKKKMGRTD